MHDVLVVDPLSHFRQQPVVPDIVKRPLDRLPTTGAVILMAIRIK
jgi:hypothetical protein